MRLTIETYWPLILLLAVPYLWWVNRRTEVDLNAKHLRLSTLIRSGIVCLLVLALMQPILYKASSYVSVVYLLDVSQSVAPGAIKKAIDWIQQTIEAGNPDHFQLVAFGANSIPVEKVEELKKVQVSSVERAGSIGQSATNISSALDRAIRSFAPNHLKRVVLVSDGNDNAGNLSAVLPRLNRENVRVHTVPIEARVDRDIWIESVLAPSNVTADEQFPVEVHVYSQFEATSVIEIKNGDDVLGSQNVRLTQGLNRIAFETRVPEETTTVVLTAQARATDDAFGENNLFRQPVVVNGRPRVLYVESHAPSAQYLHRALTLEGLLVDVASPEQLPVAVGQLDQYDAVVLSDVDPKSISAAQMQSLETYVRELGGGFILAGGENTYGKDGYSDTPIEKTLPVTFDTKKRPPTIAMVAVIDVSGSMSQGQLTIAKEAAKAPLRSLRNSDRFGVLSFNTGYNWVAPLQPAGNRSTINSQIETLYAGGGTNVYIGLNAAYAALKDAADEVKTVVLLSDGITQTADHQALTTSMIKAGINVSSISVGQRSNRELMADIAMWGKGRAYYIDSYDRVPQIFIKETELALGKTLQEQPFLPIVKKAVEAFKGIDFNKAPRLLGYVVTKAKPTSEVLLTESWTGEPLLARWQYGLGKAAAFTSDVKSRWAVEWLAWSGYPKFWAQVVRETMRRRNDEYFDFNVARKGGEAVVSINAVEKDGRFRNELQPQVRVIGPDQKLSVLDVPQVGPGAYETQLPLAQDGSYLFRAAGEGTGGPTRTLEHSYPAEYHFYPPDIQKLRSISAATGGTFQPKDADIFDAKGETTEFPIALWPWLSALVLALYIVDILLRRVRLFETR
jgi:Ca-activated chloride channel family protein